MISHKVRMNEYLSRAPNAKDFLNESFPHRAMSDFKRDWRTTADSAVENVDRIVINDVFTF